MKPSLRARLFCIDARSLGLFRILIAATLIGDLFRRWTWIKAFYSNEGVLPNHNHLFNLRETGQVWSALHAFSTPGENAFAFSIILFFYVAFLFGWHTRAFHLLSLVGLVSLTGRNILLENAGNYAAIALVMFTLFLPLGGRFSLDALFGSLQGRDEKTDLELNDRSPIPATAFSLRRGPGWSPFSIAAVAVVLQLAIIYACCAVQQRGEPWRDGSALYYALHVERWVSGLGVAVRSRAPLGLLRIWSHALYAAECMIPILLLVPVARRTTRGAAAVLMLIHGLTIGLLLSFGLFAWTLLASIALVVPTESWEAAARRGKRGRARLVIYDADCGICLYLSRLLRRLDAFGNLTFLGNDAIVKKEGDAEDEDPRAWMRARVPASVTPEIVDETVVVIDDANRVHTRGRAVAEVFAALPLGRPLAMVLRLPGFAQLLDVAYRFIAPRRHRVSALCGLAACGVEAPPSEGEQTAYDEAPPSTRTARIASATVRETLAAIVFIAMLAQTGAANAIPRALKLPQGHALAAVAAWPRMLARWDVLAPAPPDEDGWMVIDAQTRGGKSVDPLTGREPEPDLSTWRGTRMGQLWSDYLYRMHLKEWEPYQKAFRDYLAKGGPRWDERPPEDAITGFDAYWVKDRTPPPGGSPPSEVAVDKEKLFTHSRGGRLSVDHLPILNPGIRRP